MLCERMTEIGNDKTPPPRAPRLPWKVSRGRGMFRSHLESRLPPGPGPPAVEPAPAVGLARCVCEVSWGCRSDWGPPRTWTLDDCLAGFLADAVVCHAREWSVRLGVPPVCDDRLSFSDIASIVIQS